MEFNRLGPVFCPDGAQAWMKTHAANPFACHLSGDAFRVYFSGRDAENRSHISFVDIEVSDKPKVLGIAERPVLSPGEPGYFDDSGVSMGCVLQVEGRKILYFLGWNLGTTVPFRNSIGAAELSDDGTAARKLSLAPILDRSAIDPISISYPYVIKERDGYRMFYGSTTSYGKGGSTEEMTHIVRQGRSADGIHWQSDPRITLNVSSSEELGISRAVILPTAPGYRMWFSHRDRNGPFSLGYAESDDGYDWKRDDNAMKFLPAPQAGDWDSEMQCYPHVFEHRGRLWMLYCGNNYGKTGFGLAVDGSVF